MCVASLTVFVNCLVKQFAICLGVCCVCHQYDVCKISVGSDYVGLLVYQTLCLP